jgi:hypothetical protein
MATIYLQFEAEAEAEADRIAEDIRQNLNSLEEVDEADTEAETTRFGIGMMETVVLITGVVTIAKQGSELVGALRTLVQSLTGLVQDAQGLRDAFIEIGKRRVRVSELTETDFAEIAAEGETSSQPV